MPCTVPAIGGARMPSPIGTVAAPNLIASLTGGLKSIGLVSCDGATMPEPCCCG